jgi:exopolysaccharide biosynthesis polyprenyl glycosylphosphotransferase
MVHREAAWQDHQPTAGRAQSRPDGGLTAEGRAVLRYHPPRRASVPRRPIAAITRTAVAGGELAGLALAAALASAPAQGIWYVAGGLVLLLIAGGTRFRLTLRALDEAPRVFTLLGLPALGILATAAVSAVPAWLLWQAALSPFAVVTGRACSYLGLRLARRTGRLLEPVVIAGSGAVATTLIAKLQGNPELGLRPVGYVDHAPTDLAIPWLGTVEVLGDLADSAVHHLIVAFSSAREHTLVTTLRKAIDNGFEVLVVPRFFDLGLRSTEGGADDVQGLTLYWVRPAARRRRGWRTKRTLDVVTSALLLLLSAPLLGVVALLVRLSSEGPVLFRQERIGQAGRPFELLKFRTMRVTTDSDTRWSDADDPYQTTLGKFLRRTAIDELPQLWNVLRGDMSLIGPRPERPFFVERFTGEIPDYPDRHRVPVGITGWAQVHGLRGDTPIDDRVRLDNQYIEQWSIWRDLVIAARTAGAFVQRTIDALFGLVRGR